jgi:ADP-ribose pyrophosphatase
MAVERLLSAAKFSVERRVLRDPSGREVRREVVVHPGAVVILPRLDHERLVMIRNFRYSVEEELWELPAGTAEPGEPAIDTARRELIEETGFHAERMTPLAEFYTSPGVMTELMQAFVAEKLTPVGQRLEPDERIKVEIVTFARAREMFVGGELRDGKTMAVLGMYLLGKAG